MNKIYVYDNAGGASYSTSPTNNVTDKKHEIEYVRKDELVSAIEKQIKFYENSHPVNDYEKGADAGAIAALKHVLESL